MAPVTTPVLPEHVAKAPPARRKGDAWLVGPGFDGVFFLASALAPLACWAAIASGASAYAVLAVVAVISNGPHLTSTWTRLYLDEGTWRSRPGAFIGGPLLLLAAVASVLAWVPSPLRLLNSVILYWATWHFAAQCYGLLRLYQRRSGEPPRTGHRVESSFVFLMGLAGLTWRLHYGPRELFGQQAYALPMHKFLVWGIAGAALGSLALVVVEQAWRGWRGGGVAWTRVGFLFATLLGFGVPFFVIKDGTAAFAAAACWHGFQYLGIVYHFNRRRYSGGVSASARVVSWASQPGRAWAFAGLVLGLAGVTYGAFFGISWVSGTAPWKVAQLGWTTLTLAHYWTDGLIWKMRTGTVAATLQAA